MAVDTLLSQFSASGPVKAIGYADDVLLIARGIDPLTIAMNMQRAINTALGWANISGLSYNQGREHECPSGSLEDFSATRQ